MSPLTISVISAITALIASIVGPIVTLSVARRQFSANVLSSNRQKWIENFRDRLSDFIALMTAVSLLKSRWRAAGGELVQAAASDPSIVGIAEKVTLAYAQLSLLVKDDDNNHQHMMKLAHAALDTLRNADAAGDEMERNIIELTNVGRTIIRAEWARVKRGV